MPQARDKTAHSMRRTRHNKNRCIRKHEARGTGKRRRQAVTRLQRPHHAAEGRTQTLPTVSGATTSPTLVGDRPQSRTMQVQSGS